MAGINTAQRVEGVSLVIRDRGLEGVASKRPVIYGKMNPIFNHFQGEIIYVTPNAKLLRYLYQHVGIFCVG